MRGSGNVKCCVVVFFVYILSVYDVSPAAIGHVYPQISESGLYNASDKVVVLNVTTLASTIYRSKRSWLVEFYSSWCGHCQRFAPFWKSFAKDIHAWRNIVAVAAIDCAKEGNTQTCREHEIMLYPTVKFFGVDSKPNSLGLILKADSYPNKMRKNLTLLLQNEYEKERGPSWPNINPYRSLDLKNFLQSSPKAAKHRFLLFEEPGSVLGTEIILDLQTFQDIYIRRVTSNNQPLQILSKVKSFPSLVRVESGASQTLLNLRSPITRESLVSFIMKITNTELPKETTTMEIPVVKPALITEEPEDSEDVLYQPDLEKTLQYSLTREIALVPMMEGEKLTTLKGYLEILVSGFPFGARGNLFLEVLNEMVQGKERLSGKEFGDFVRAKEAELAPVFKESVEWMGCKGSASKYRGYPCGLWTMFHVLSVTNSDPVKVLRAIHGYVGNFFGCEDCRDHFLKMAEKNQIFQVRDADEAILWLWRAHNEVNSRLAGDVTEDPMHKKRQYPSGKQCPSCRGEDGKWNEASVLVYLKGKYQGSQSEIGNVEAEKQYLRQKYGDILEGRKKFGWDFTFFDISICVVLYVASAFILITVCIKFAVKKTYRKKAFLHKLILRL